MSATHLKLSDVARLMYGPEGEWLRDLELAEQRAVAGLDVGGLFLEEPSGGPATMAEAIALASCANDDDPTRSRSRLIEASKKAGDDPLSDYIFSVTRAAHMLGLAMGWEAARRLQSGGVR
jgi:hypothetical protein